MEQNHLERITQLEAKHKKLTYAYIASLIILIFLFVFKYEKNEANSEDILKAKGLVVVDNNGKPRIIIGAPITELDGRIRTDSLIGISYIDENGVDRVTFGQQPDAMTTDGLKKRRVQGVGILIHDSEGIERGGYGVLADETALLTVDWPKTGEAVVMSSGLDFSAFGLFHKSELGIYREAIVIGNIASKEQSFIKVVDTNYVERLKLELNAADNVTVQRFDKNGFPLDK